MNYTLRIAILSVAASAIAAAATYKVNIPMAVVLDGHELQPGDYRVEVDNDTAVLQKGKQKVSAKVRTETVDQKFGSTSVRYVKADDGHYTMAEISIGGTKTKLIISIPPNQQTAVSKTRIPVHWSKTLLQENYRIGIRDSGLRRRHRL